MRYGLFAIVASVALVLGVTTWTAAIAEDAAAERVAREPAVLALADLSTGEPQPTPAAHALATGQPGGVPVADSPIARDPLAKPAETVSLVASYWRLGGWPLTLCLLGVACAALSVRLRPKDRDGDGRLDPEGWRGYVWIGATALLLPIVPLLDRAAGVLGASWGAVGTAAAAGVTLAWGYAWGMRSRKVAA